MSGSIYRRKDGRYSCCVSISGRQKHLYGKTPAEVAAKRDALLAEQAGQQRSAPSAQTVAEYLTFWLENVVKLRNAENTHKSYSDMCRLHISPAIGHYQLRSLGPEQVQTMCNRLHQGGLSARSTKYALAILHRALNQAMNWGYVTRNVAALVDPPRGEKYEAATLGAEQLEGFFAAVRGHRLEALYWLALLGLRRGELLALSWRDVDQEAGTLRVRKSKTGAGLRTLPLSPTLLAVLAQHWERQQAERTALGVDWKEHGLVFPSEKGTPISGRNLVRHFKSVLARAGLPDLRFHDMRHTAATLLLEQGQHPKTVQMLLGHSQVTTTLDIYSHVSLEEKKAAVTSLEGLFRRLSG